MEKSILTPQIDRLKEEFEELRRQGLKQRENVRSIIDSFDSLEKEEDRMGMVSKRELDVPKPKIRVEKLEGIEGTTPEEKIPYTRPSDFSFGAGEARSTLSATDEFRSSALPRSLESRAQSEIQTFNDYEDPTSQRSIHNFTTPLSSSSETPTSIKLELEALRKYPNHISFRDYLERGYRFYITWLKMTLGCDENVVGNLRFCIARNINMSFPNKYPMGVDLEVRYIFRRLENMFGAKNMHLYKDSMQNSIQDNLSISDIHNDSFIQQYFRNPKSFATTLSEVEFFKRLHLVPTEMVDKHSSRCWRGYNHTELNKTPYPVSLEDIGNGENLAPPSSRHIGIQMLEIHGYLPPVTNPRHAKSFSVTYI